LTNIVKGNIATREGQLNEDIEKIALDEF